VDSETTNYSGNRGLSAPAAWADAQNEFLRRPQTGIRSVKFANKRNELSFAELYWSTLTFAEVIYRINILKINILY